MNRDEKLKKLSKASKELFVVTDSQEYIEELNKQVNVLKQVLENGIEITNLQSLLEEFKIIGDLKPLIEDLSKAIESIEIPEQPEVPDSIKLEGVDKLVGALKDKSLLQSKPQPIVLKEVTDQLKLVVKAVQNRTVSQDASDFTPVRRVRRIGNRLMFDDNEWSGGGGGGGPASNTIFFKSIDQGSAGTSTLVAAVANQSIKVVSYVIVFSGAATAIFKSGTTALSGEMSFGANGGVSSIGTNDLPILSTSVGEALNITTTTTPAKGHMNYYLE